LRFDSGPFGCSVDPATGNLAVTNYIGRSSSPGNVAIYAQAKGTAKFYSTPIYYVYFCGYDDKGNLYVDGKTNDEAFAFAELRKHGSTFTSITLNEKVYFPGGVQWDGKYVTVGDQEYDDREASAIYQTTGSGGKVVGTTLLSSAQDVIGYWIDGKTVVGADTALNDVEFYKYPKGGSATKTLTGFNEPVSVAVSR
jgi:hypothetical protein